MRKNIPGLSKDVPLKFLHITFLCFVREIINKDLDNRSRKYELHEGFHNYPSNQIETFFGSKKKLFFVISVFVRRMPLICTYNTSVKNIYSTS